MPEPGSVARSAGADLETLARFTAQLEIGAIPGEIVRRAQAFLLYGLSVGVAGVAATSPHLAARALDAEYPGTEGPATRLVDGRRTIAGAAAFANAVLMHARTQEDAHPAGHVGVVILPAAMAVAEQADASASDLLATIVAGYEVALRIGRDHVADASTRGLRSTPLYGVFGAAAAAARLLRLDPPRSMHALALAANAAGGLREFVNAGTDEFPFHAGFAARNGIMAALLAQAGVTAASTTLGGAAGFFRAFGEADKDYGRRIADRLGEAFELLDVTYKPYPTCQFHRSVIRGVLALRDRVAERELQSMQIRMHPFEADFFGVRYAGPYTSFSQTFMSAPYCAALAWTSGAVTYRGLHDFDAPELLRNVRKVEVIADPSRPRYMPRVAVRCSDGREQAWEEYAGGEGYRLTWQAAEAMTRALCNETGVTGNAVSKLIAAVDRLARGGTTQAVVAACRAAIAEAEASVEPANA
ncbi:MAG TPA: MmgE/PrpD family protein [Casimicrobiaceae bacterium]|jgi:2-methylcitrate dehydratase PrpD|nr:MmgE/PrpD family protein [Casimicrobiaceae bacterium]